MRVGRFAATGLAVLALAVAGATQATHLVRQTPHVRVAVVPPTPPTPVPSKPAAVVTLTQAHSRTLGGPTLRQELSAINALARQTVV